MEGARHSTPPSLLGSPAYRLRLQGKMKVEDIGLMK
nr:hypothetical protein Iba_chr04aCG9790 [Ipomoea batatas]